MTRTMRPTAARSRPDRGPQGTWAVGLRPSAHGTRRLTTRRRSGPGGAAPFYTRSTYRRPRHRRDEDCDGRYHSDRSPDRVSIPRPTTWKRRAAHAESVGGVSAVGSGTEEIAPEWRQRSRAPEGDAEPASDTPPPGAR